MRTRTPDGLNRGLFVGRRDVSARPLTLTAEACSGTATIVVAVDADKKTITFKHTDNGAWKQTAATWDEKTT